jgi:hypothetical protein
VNNNPDVEDAEGGSHWSLLVYRRGKKKNTSPSRKRASMDEDPLQLSDEDDSFLHYDSAGGMNARAVGLVNVHVAVNVQSS